MKKYFKLPLILMLLTSVVAFPQLSIFNSQLQNIASPQVSSMLRYSDFLEVDYIGKAEVSVPLYEFNLGKLQIPVQLAYNTKGNKVSDVAPAVGLGWSLIAGGAVTQHVNDLNDFMETYSYYSQGGFEWEQSFEWHRITKGYSCDDYPSKLHQAAVLCLNPRIGASDDNIIDSAPDLFLVNAPGFSDKFYVTKNNDIYRANFVNSPASKLLTHPTDEITVDCGVFEGGMHFGAAGRATVFYSPKGFELVAESGLVYKFDQKERSRITQYPQDFLSYSIDQVNTWHLSSITDPVTSKSIKYSYDFTSDNDYEYLGLDILNYMNFGDWDVNKAIELDRNPPPHKIIENYSRITSYKFMRPRLKEIKTDDATIRFEYDHPRLDIPSGALSRITVSDNRQRKIKEIKFIYSYFTSTDCDRGNDQCNRLKLLEINDCSLGSYLFAYDNNIFPPRNSSKTDYQGYFNGNDSNISFSKQNFWPRINGFYPSSKIYFYPELERDNFIPFPLVNHTPHVVTGQIDRTPSIESKLGLLERITYPTGGALKLEYENDDFLYENQRYILGSTRIKSMTLLDSDGVTKRNVRYAYVDEDGRTSGRVNFFTTPSDIEHMENSLSSGIGFNTGSIIGYSRVVESTDVGWIERRYTNFNDYEDTFMQSTDSYIKDADKNFFKFAKFPNSYVQSFNGRRGLLLQLNYYSKESSSYSKKIKLEYEYVVKDSLKLSKQYSNRGYPYLYSDGSSSINMLRYFSRLKHKVTENVFPDRTLTEKESYFYDDNRLIRKETVKGQGFYEEITRNAKDKGIFNLINANILEDVIEHEVIKNGQIISRSSIEYDPYSSRLLPHSVSSYNQQLKSSETVLTYDFYDVKGNVAQYTSNGGLSTCLIWGYDQTKLIAKIEGIKWSDLPLDVIASVVTASNPSSPLYSEDELLDKLFILRKYLNNYSVTTYTYKPLVGIASITPPSGITEIYAYDLSNRLESIKDVNGNIIKEFKYNYTPKKYYNKQVSRVFIRNNCGSNRTGGNYTYTVPAEKYFSTVGQTEADELALNDVNANGQNAANIHGSCTPITCTVTLDFAGNGSISASGVSNYKVSLVFSSGPYSTNLPWTTGVKIGTIAGNCRPIADHSSYNGQVYYTITTDGEIIIKTHLSNIIPNNTTKSYDLFFPVK